MRLTVCRLAPDVVTALGVHLQIVPRHDSRKRALSLNKEIAIANAIVPITDIHM